MFRNNLTKKASVLAFIMLISGTIMARDMSYQIIDIEDISRYTEDRLVYQQVEYIVDPEQHQREDTSIAVLLIIRDRKMYLFKDGFDDPKIVEENRLIKETQNELIRNELWERQIDGQPDFLVITDRRTEILKRITTKPTDNIQEAYSKYYQTIRDKFIKEHVDVFRGLLINRKEAEIKVVRTPLAKHINDTTNETKYFTSVTAKTKDGMIYYAEDSDGDGVTESFSVDLPDGFNWGYKSGPNIIFIYKNTQVNVKNLIQNLAKEAWEGTTEEGAIIDKEFSTLEKQTIELIDDIVRMDPETKKILKKDQ